MASKDKRLPGNAAGKYYVDEDCIGCSACVGEAPDNFRMMEDEALAIVYRQPDDEDQVEACNGAKDSCPVDAIGDDGL